MSSDSEFYKNFKSRMDVLGLPAPETLFGTLQLTLANLTAMASAIHKFGPKMPVSYFVRCIPFGGGSALAAGAFAELSLSIGAVAASFYVGACIGSLIGAVTDTYGSLALIKLQGWAGDMAKLLGMPMSMFLSEIVEQFPAASPIRASICVAANKFFSPTACRAQ